MEQPRIAISYLQWLHDYIGQQGVDPLPVLGPLPVWEKHPYITMAQWRQRLDQAAQVLGDPDLGLHFGQTIGPQRFGVLGYLLHHCDNFGQVMLRLWHYRLLFFHLRQVTPRWHRGADVSFAWGGDGETVHYQEEVFAIVASVQFARLITGQPLRPTAVGLMNPPPADISALQDFLGCRIEFNQDATRVRAPVAWGGLPTVQPDAALRALLERQAEAMLAVLPAADELVQAVRRHIVALLPEGEPTQPRVAGRLFMSSRSLHRHLAQRNHTFRDVLEQTRRELAESYLHDRRLRLPDIALLLGYSEQSAFTHAFRRWTGTTPSTWRRNT